MPRPSGAPVSSDGFSAPFAGFALPTSNTTYTPNQFFDVCLPHASRGCLRLVALMLRKTLGWSDEHGRPQQERIRLNYADFIAAGISRKMVKSSVDEAIRYRFIRCIREGRPKQAGKPAVSALYELNWDEGREYQKDPSRFRGFFAGEGNRTYIPNQFFDRVVPAEKLAVVKVVGSVIRFSIGFANKWGHRRTLATLSFSDMQRYTHIRNRSTLSEALTIALQRNYLQRVEEGYFDPDGGKTSRAAVYAVKWLKEAADESIGGKNGPARTEAEDRSGNRTGIGRKSGPADRWEKRTDIQITNTNNTLKQHRAASAAHAAALSSKEGDVAAELLCDQGFDSVTARRLAERYPIERILRQLDWIDRRGTKRNRLGMLRLAIEQDWSKPSAPPRVGSTQLPAGERDGRIDALRKDLANRFRDPYSPN